MSKKNDRETTTLGHPSLADIKARIEKQVDKTVRTQSEIAKLAAKPPTEDRSRFAELMATEVDAAIAHGQTQDAQLAEGVYPASADPAHVVGLDAGTPDSETAVDGDPPRTAEPSNAG